MPEYELRDNLDRLPKVIYFTDSFFALHIDRKGNAFYCKLPILGYPLLDGRQSAPV